MKERERDKGRDTWMVLRKENKREICEISIHSLSRNATLGERNKKEEEEDEEE